MAGRSGRAVEAARRPGADAARTAGAATGRGARGPAVAAGALAAADRGGSRVHPTVRETDSRSRLAGDRAELADAAVVAEDVVAGQADLRQIGDLLLVAGRSRRRRAGILGQRDLGGGDRVGRVGDASSVG